MAKSHLVWHISESLHSVLERDIISDGMIMQAREIPLHLRSGEECWLLLRRSRIRRLWQNQQCQNYTSASSATALLTVFSQLVACLGRKASVCDAYRVCETIVVVINRMIHNLISLIIQDIGKLLTHPVAEVGKMFLTHLWQWIRYNNTRQVKGDWYWCALINGVFLCSPIWWTFGMDGHWGLYRCPRSHKSRS